MSIFDHGYDGFDDENRVKRATIDFDSIMTTWAQELDRPSDPIGEAIERAESAACVIFVTQNTPNGLAQWTGSGFLVPGNYIITADHVLPDAGAGDAEVKISFDGDLMVPVSVVRGDEDVDVGILHCAVELPVAPVEFTQTPVSSGDIIAVIGAPEGWDNVVTVGRVSATDMTPPAPPDPSWRDMTFIDAHILEGSSGSMVIDIMGHVVGMVMGVIGRRAADTGMGQNAIVPAHRILEAIQNTSS